MEKKRIFLSYGREPEVVDFVKWLKGELESAGLGVWLDTEDIAAGSDWRAEIGKALKACCSLIAVITKKYVGSLFCKNELYVAHEKKKDVFPVIYDEDWKTATGCDGVEYVISAVNWTFFPGGRRDSDSLQKLVSALSGEESTNSTDPVSDLGNGSMTPRMPTLEDSAVEPDVTIPLRCTVDMSSLLPHNQTTKWPRNEELLSLKMLRSMTTESGEKINVIKLMASHWKEFGALLDFDNAGATLANIERKRHFDPEACCQEMMERWLKGQGRQPASRELLVELLQDCELTVLAEQVEHSH